MDTIFHANNWLEHEGDLVIETRAFDMFSKFGINKKRVSQFAHRLGIHELVTPGLIDDVVPDDEQGIKCKRKLRMSIESTSTALLSRE